jgi:hypothetical protein
MIWTLNYDGTNSQVDGGTTFLVNSAINGAMNPASFGVSGGGWGGNRSTSNLPVLFSSTDTRAMFTWPGGSTKATNDLLTLFTDGLPVVKFKNITSAGKDSINGVPTSSDGTSASTDFAVFRLAEQYLIYAEAVLRGGSGGTMAQALTYVNALRARAKAAPIADLTVMESVGPQVQFNVILNERARELYWECTRRTDLIRYGLFTGNYTWPWKGGLQNGQAVDSHYNLFPLPSSVLTSDPNLKQNPGYGN